MYIRVTTLGNIWLCHICWLILCIIWYDCCISHVWRVLGRICNICCSCFILWNIWVCCSIYNCYIGSCRVLCLWDRIQYFLSWTYTHNFIIEFWIELTQLAVWEVHEWRVAKSSHHVIILNRWNVWLHPLGINQNCNLILISCKTYYWSFNDILHLNCWNW